MAEVLKEPKKKINFDELGAEYMAAQVLVPAKLDDLIDSIDSVSGILYVMAKIKFEQAKAEGLLDPGMIGELDKLLEGEDDDEDDTIPATTA